MNIYSSDEQTGSTNKNAGIDIMEGINDASLINNSSNDSFDSIFNKELDLDIGNPYNIYNKL